MNQNGAYAGGMGARLLPVTSIPVIDIAALSGTDRAAFEAAAREIGAACQTVGFFYIRNQGVPQPLIDRTYALSRQFRTAPLETPMEVGVGNSPGNRGYTPTNDEDPDADPELYPLPQFTGPGRPPAYERIVAGQHLAGFSINGAKHLRRRVLSGDLEIDVPIRAENPFKRRAVNEYEDSAR